MKYGPGNKLLPEHALYWLEEELAELDKVENWHFNQHKNMEKHFNLSGPEKLSKWFKDVKLKDREYHLRLHLKYWMDTNQYSDLVQKYLSQYGNSSLDEVRPE